MDVTNRKTKDKSFGQAESCQKLGSVNVFIDKQNMEPKQSPAGSPGHHIHKSTEHERDKPSAQ